MGGDGARLQDYDLPRLIDTELNILWGSKTTFQSHADLAQPRPGIHYFGRPGGVGI